MTTMRTVDLDDNELDDEDSPPPYQPTTEAVEPGLDKGYTMSAPGAVKLVEAALVLIGFVAVLAQGFPGSAFVLWVTLSAFVTAVTLYILRAMGVYDRIAFLPLLEFIYLIVYSVKLLVCSVLAIVYFSRGPSVAASGAICLSALLLFLVDTSIAYKHYIEARNREERRRDASSSAGQSMF